MLNKCAAGVVQAVKIPWIPTARRADDVTGSVVTQATAEFVTTARARYQHGLISTRYRQSESMVYVLPQKEKA